MSLIIRKEDIEKIISFELAVEVMEQAFKEMGESNKEECISPPRFAIPLTSGGGGIGFMPAYLKKSKKLGIKIISHIPNNPKRYKLPIIQGVFLLINPDNGKILSIINAGIITSYRTAAAAVAVSKKLAISNPKKLAIFGAGTQGMSVLMAMKEIFNFKEISIFDIIDEKVERFISKAKEEISVKIKITKSKDPAQAAENSDIITTVTPSKIPFLEAGMLKKGVHINAMGSEMPHKHELAPSVYKVASKVFIDSYQQSLQSGEFKEAIDKKVFKEWNTVSDLFAGRVAGRQNREDITIFKSTGLGVQDVALGYKIYQIAKKKGWGEEVEI